MDKVLFILTLIYTILGLVMIFSASSITAVLYSGVAEYYFFQKQLFIVLASWAIGFFVLCYPTQRYKFWGRAGMLAIIVTLVAIFSYGSITNSARSWFDLGVFSLQPSEFAKSISIVYLAVYFEKIIRTKAVSLNNVIKPFSFVLVVVALTTMQPDLGTAAIIGGIAFCIFLALPINKREIKNLKLIGIATVFVAAIVVVFGGNFLNAEQSSRLTYRAPCTRYTEKTGYQVCNGFIAMSNGGLFGAGLGNSKQKYLYLPEAHTDFVFPIIVEELGSLVAVVIILGFIVMLYRILKIAKNAANLRGSVIAYGTFLLILLHLIINFCGILALTPLTGVPLPFLSYGGSFYLNLCFLLFLTQRVQVEGVIARTSRVLSE